MKKLVAFVLALVMVLSLCTVAFADGGITSVDVGVIPLDIESFKGITSESFDVLEGLISTVDPDSLDWGLKTIYLFDKGDNRICQFFGGLGWYDSGYEPVSVNWSNVAYALVEVAIRDSNQEYEHNVFDDSVTVTRDSGASNFSKIDADAYIEGFWRYYDEASDLDSIGLYIKREFDSDSDTDSSNFGLLGLIGAYWTAKYIYEKLSEASTMPYLAPIVKVVIPMSAVVAGAAVIGHVLCHMGAPK